MFQVKNVSVKISLLKVFLSLILITTPQRNLEQGLHCIMTISSTRISSAEHTVNHKMAHLVFILLKFSFVSDHIKKATVQFCRGLLYMIIQF